MKTEDFTPITRIGFILISSSIALAFGAASALGQSTSPVVAPATPIPVTQVQVTRASTHQGNKVISSDGQMVGKISDFIFDRAQPPHLAYIVVKTGGVLDVGGRNRAVPAAAITLGDRTAHINITKAQYQAMPALHGDPAQALSDQATVMAVDRAFGVAEPTVRQDVTRVPNSLVSYSDMMQKYAYSTTNGQLGEIDDAWISLNRDRAPYIEIKPTLDPFELPGKTRYELPLVRLQSVNNGGTDYTFAVTTGDLYHARAASRTPGVEVADTNFNGATILRLTVPAVPEPKAASAGAPTGYSSSEVNGPNPAVTAAAQSIRQALDANAGLRSQSIQVVPEGNQVQLRGNVPDSATRDDVFSTAQRASNGVAIDNQVTIGSR